MYFKLFNLLPRLRLRIDLVHLACKLLSKQIKMIFSKRYCTIESKGPKSLLTFFF